MKDIHRIDRICDKFKELWKLYPNQRFSQLFHNFVMLRSTDLFHQEDSVSEKNIDEQIKIVRNLLHDKLKKMYNEEQEETIEFINGSINKF